MKYYFIRPVAILLMGFTYLISRFINIPILENLVSIFALVIVLTFLPFLKSVPRILISVLLIISVTLFYFGEGFEALIFSFDANAGLLAIFIFVPLISIPIQEGKYLENLEIIFNYYIKSTKQLYLYLKISLMGIGAVMNLGTIPIMHQLTNTQSLKEHDLIRIKAFNRGFSLSFLWSPYFVSVALILSFFNISWINLFPFGVGFALIGLMLGYLFERKTNVKIEMPKVTDKNLVRSAKRKVIQLILIVTMMTVVTITIENYVDLSILTIIPVVATVTALIWSFIYLTPKQLAKKLFIYTQERLPKMGNELSLFIMAGVFGVALLNAGASDWIVYLLEITGISHVLLLIPIAGIVIIFLSFIGVHPLITITAMSMTFSAMPIFADEHLILALGLLISWMVTVMSSPLSATNLLVASLANMNSYRVGWKLNGAYSITLWLIYYLFIVVFYFIF